jgi:hypothetical protein
MSPGIRQALKVPVHVPGSILVEQLTNADVVDGELTFEEPVAYVHAYNSHATHALILTVNEVVITIPAVTAFGPVRVGVTPDEVVTVAGDSTTFIISRCE